MEHFPADDPVGGTRGLGGEAVRSERDLSTLPVFAVVRSELVKFLRVVVAGLLPFASAVAAHASGGLATRTAVDIFTQSFHSAPALHPPIVSMAGRDPDPRY